MTTEKIPIYVADEDARKFLLFQEHYEIFNVLLNAGVFNQKSAAITLHFDHIGTLRTIQRADTLYFRKHSV